MLDGVGAEHSQLGHQRRLAGAGPGQQQPRQPVAARALGDRERAAHRADLAGQRQLADHRAAVDGVVVDLAAGDEQRDRQRQVEARADLAQVGRREVHGDAPQRELEARVHQRRPHALTRLADRLVGEPDDRERRQALADVRLDPHAAAGHAVHGEGGDPGDHGSERALEVVQPDELVVTVDEHADGVEAQVVVPRAVAGLEQPGGGHPADLGLLGRRAGCRTARPTRAGGS